MVVGIFIVVCLAGTMDVDSVGAVCSDYPERVKALFAALDLGRPGLEPIKREIEGGNPARACEELLAYYRNGKSGAWLRRAAPEPGDGRVAAADAILEDTFTEYTIPAKVPRRPDGHLDWSYNGPQNDREWGWGLNRHHWGGDLVDAYFTTGNPIYAAGFDRLVRDWIVSNPYQAVKSSTPQWRGLEVFARICWCWARAFYSLQDVEAFTPAARILMLSSIPEHAHYARSFHSAGGNWITMEMLGLATMAACWPEFKGSDEWYQYATTRLVPELTAQIYPDGAQKELTSTYHRVALHSFSGMIDLARQANRPLPPEFRATIERMYNYIAYSMEPNGCAPLNNDSNLDNVRDEVRSAADAFNRRDWLYIATNGKEGDAPQGLPSVVFPWAGQAVMRSGWDADAQSAFFDAGPLGIGHWHCDKLHLSVSAFGRDILVDGGRYTYQAGPWRRYFVSSLSHNVVLVDGKGQVAYEKEATAPIEGSYKIAPEYDFVHGDYTGGYEGIEGTATHTRTVAYLRGEYFMVVDRIATDRPRTIQALWHFHPACTVTVDGNDVESVDEGLGNIRIVPVAAFPWRVEIVKGREEPDIQGWWSREYNIKEPNACAIYSAEIKQTATFAWVIAPGKGRIPPIRAEIVKADDNAVALRVGREGQHDQMLTVPVQGVGFVVSEVRPR